MVCHGAKRNNTPFSSAIGQKSPIGGSSVNILTIKIDHMSTVAQQKKLKITLNLIQTNCKLFISCHLC